jgi:hypothetical protein
MGRKSAAPFMLWAQAAAEIANYGPILIFGKVFARARIILWAAQFFIIFIFFIFYKDSLGIELKRVDSFEFKSCIDLESRE